jgi:heme/copper-type cytochrome/quinol oxidase subunit 2
MGLRLFPVQASTISVETDHLLYFLVAVAAFFSLLIFAAILYFAIRYRRRSERDLPPVVHGAMALEILWNPVDRDPAGSHHGDVRLGRQYLLQGEPAAG